jgi:hypothetical protein
MLDEVRVVSATDEYRTEPPPPYPGEEPGALWHFSEDPAIRRFEPRPPAGDGAVWAVDDAHAPLFWFPRDCPRVCAWVGTSTTDEDRERFFGSASARNRLNVVESGWERVIGRCRLYGYRMPAETFVLIDGSPGYWQSTLAVSPIERVEIGDLLTCHERAAIDLRVVDDVWAFYDEVAASTLSRSASRLRNSAHRQRGVPGVGGGEGGVPGVGGGEGGERAVRHSGDAT